MWIYAFLFIISFLYSSVGHGGGSGYLAIFHLFDLDPYIASSTALILNLVVSSIAFFNYRRFFRFSYILPFIVASIPAAYIGGSIQFPAEFIRKLTGIVIFVAGIRMFFNFTVKFRLESLALFPRIALCSFIGGVLGFLAGVIGIGGGIFLSPVLIFLGYDAKVVASLSAFFIFINSTSGIMARLKFVSLDLSLVIGSVFVVMIGGFIGSYMGSHKLSSRGVKVLLGIVLVVAGIKLFL